jgi:hypothetical protein
MMNTCLTLIAVTLTGMILVGSADAEPFLSSGPAPLAKPIVPAGTPQPVSCSTVVLDGTTYTICPEKLKPVPPRPTVGPCYCNFNFGCRCTRLY